MFTQRVVWAMQEPTDEFGEIVKGTEGRVVGALVTDNTVTHYEVEWDVEVLTVEEAWMVDRVA